MNELLDLYQDIILEHNKRPRNKGLPDPADATAEGLNPVCGDEISVGIQLRDGVIQALGFEGQGCAISTASASLMTEQVKGKNKAQAKEEIKRVMKMLSEEEPTGEEIGLDTWGELAALQGVRRFPARIKCATLAWHALDAALDGKSEVTTE